MARPTQSPERYSTSGDGWDVSAQATFKEDFPESTQQIPPLHISKGPALPPILPLLEADGLIVTVDGQPLASPNTIAEIAQAEADSNPHRSPVKHSEVLGKAMGGTIPIIPVTTANFLAMGTDRDQKNLSAGVKSVDYLYEGPQISGIPVSLLNNINFFLVKEKTRPADVFEVYDLAMSADYSIQQLVIATKQGDDYLDKVKYETFMSQIASRISGMRDEFNAIKKTFFEGAVPPNNGWTEYTQVATSDEAPSDHQVVTKSSQLIAVVQ
jgi:hypothetical protein